MDVRIRAVLRRELQRARLASVYALERGMKQLGGGLRVMTTDVGGLPRMPRCGQISSEHSL